MKGLIIKDFLNLKKYIITLIPVILLFTFITYQSGDSSFLVGMVVMLFTMMSITSISYDDLAKWDRYALAMPISRKTIILSKYLLAIILSAIGVLVSTSIGFIIGLYRGGFHTLDFMLKLYSVFAISILFLSIILPLIYKFGVEKTRLLMMAVVAIPLAIYYLLNKIGIALPNESQFMSLIKISPLILIIFLIISISISNIIYKKMDI